MGRVHPARGVAVVASGADRRFHRFGDRARPGAQQRGRAQRAVRFYERGIERLEGRWQGKGVGGERFDDPAHPYAEDLDLFGKGSLYELLCTVRLRTGEETLARFLLVPASPEAARSRQVAIEELRPRLDFREEMALLGEELRSGINPGDLAAWSEEPAVLDSRRARVAAAVLSGAAVGSAIVWAVFGFPELLLAVGIGEAVLFLKLRTRIQRVVARIGDPAYGLALFAEVLRKVERERFGSPRLEELRRSLEVEGMPPSRRIAKLNRLIELLDSRDNVAMRVIGPPLMWTTQLAFAIEAWRKQNGGQVRRWLAATGEIEALLALAGYSWEHPADVFPQFAERGPCFDATAIAHPLLPEHRAVRNDIRLCSEMRVMVVSGSNMSGKSTLLRTIGVNSVLAMAGAPVRAGALRLSPVAVGASIRTLDSLQGGTSRFYAEITRLRQLVEIAGGELPLLFLLDELLHGTNSHDRRIGGEAVVRSLVERGGFGLLTTHDLALAHIADVLAPRAANVHFEDQIEDGNVRFDYRLRPGVVRKSNALELMRSIGLDV
jgi:hypothetical protein